MNYNYDDLSPSVKEWNKAYSRTSGDLSSTLEPQTGFELSGIEKALEAFCGSHQSNSNRCVLGYFIYFYRDDGSMVNSIADIEIKKLEAVLNSSSGSNEHWLTRWADSGGKIEVTPVSPAEMKAKGWVISHFDDAIGANYATPDTTADRIPLLALTEGTNVTADASRGSASEYGIQTIRGYRESLRIAYLGYDTLLQMFMAYGIGGGKPHSEKELKFIFTGAEINHGEMTSPLYQHERFSDWRDSPGGPVRFPNLDTSITPTLKVEAVVLVDEATREFRGAETELNVRTLDPNVSLPGVKVLAPCRRYWFIVQQITKSLAGQVRFHDEKGLKKEQEAIKNINDILSEPETRKKFGSHFEKR